MGKRQRRRQRERRDERRRERSKRRTYAAWLESLAPDQQDDLDELAVRGREDDFDRLARELGAPQLW